VATEALQVIHIAAQPPKIRRTVHADVDKTTPHMLYRRIFELRKDPPQALCHHRHQVGRRARGITHPPAEQHAVIGTETEVIQNEIVVAHRCIAGNQLPAK